MMTEPPPNPTDPEFAPTVTAAGPPPVTHDPDRPGPHIRYRFDAFIARGGMGEVWRGVDTVLGREVALKVIRGGALGEEGVPRFREEARLVSRLQHPGIVPVHDLGELPDGRPFFVMKLIEGRTLSDLLRARPEARDDGDRWLLVFEQVCRVVAYAHGKGVLHRDLKPSNVMIGAFGEVQVMDWGIAKLLSELADAPDHPVNPPAPEESPESETTPRAQTTRTGVVKGTAAYMAPEQALGQNSRVGPRSDVFGLGGILCVILTGHPPYEGRSGSEVLRKAQQADLAEAFERLDKCGAEPGLVAVAKRCLTADPEGRPNAAEVLTAVEHCRQLRRLRSSLPPAGPLTRAVLARPYFWAVALPLLPHVVGAALDLTYNLLWVAAHPVWGKSLGAAAGLLIGYTAAALVITGIVTFVLTRPWLRTLDRLAAGQSVCESELDRVRRVALQLPVWGFVLSGLGWLPGAVTVPWAMGWLDDGPTVLHFVLSFSIAGLVAMTYCSLAAEFLVLRVAYPKLWLVPHDLKATVQKELRRVPIRLLGLPLVAALVPLVAALAVILNPATMDPAASATPVGRLVQGLAFALVVVGMIGCVVTGLIAHFLRGIVSGFSAFLGGGEARGDLPYPGQ